MNLQDRAYAVGIFIVLGICCIGAYVAVSGYFNANPGGLSLSLSSASGTPTARVAAMPSATDTEELPTDSLVAPGTPLPPTATPKGFKPTLTPLSRGTPSPAFLADIPTITPGPSPTLGSAPSPTADSSSICGGYAYCPRAKGPPDPRAPASPPCPRTYAWGFVLDKQGNGVPGLQIKYTGPSGESGTVKAKSEPDPPGRWDQVAGSGTWIFQLVDGRGNVLSPSITMQPQAPAPAGGCPSRLDFVEQ